MSSYQAKDRRQTNSYKWTHYTNEVLPLWVADMDFPTAPQIIEAIQNRLSHPVLGYEDQPESLKEAITTWHKQKYDWIISSKDPIFFSGVVSTIHFLYSLFSEPGDEVITFIPTYPPFLQAHLPYQLKQHALPLNYDFSIDFTALEKSITEKTQFLLLCSPHNPVGKVWKHTELVKLLDLVRAHDLILISDEIWADLVYPGKKHIPIASLDQAKDLRIFTLMAPSKTFNIPGLGFSYCLANQAEDKATLKKSVHGPLPEINVLSMVAAETAYKQGREWLKMTLARLASNKQLVLDFIQDKLPTIQTHSPEATYLLWLKINAELPQPPYDYFLEKAGVALNNGVNFGPGYDNYVRLNFATEESILIEALEKIKTSLN